MIEVRAERGPSNLDYGIHILIHRLRSNLGVNLFELVTRHICNDLLSVPIHPDLRCLGHGLSVEPTGDRP